MFGQRTTDPEPVPERAIEVEPSAEPVSAGGVFETGERWRVWATRRLATRRGLGEILDAVLDGLMKGTGAERGFLALERAEGPDQVASDGMEAAVLAREQHERRAREAVQTHRPVLDEGPPPMAYLPLLHGERVVAVAYLEGPPGSGPASEADLLEFCGEAAEVLDSARAYSRAVQDPLTGVPVHPYFLARLGEEIRKADRYHRPISVLAVGLDHFGLVNEVHGRAAGDSVLAEAASVVRARLREVDLIARRGGDVFLVALPETDRPGATVTAERIRRALEGHGFEAAASAPEGTVPAAAAHGRSPLGTSVSLTASVGLAAYPRDAADAGALVDRALDALTAAKRERNRVWTAAGAPRDEAVTATGTGAINFRDLGRAADELIETLGKVSQMELDLDRLLRHVLGRVMELTRAERGLVALVDGAGGLDMHGAQYRRADAPLYNGFAVPEGVLERVLDSGTGALVREVAPGRVPGPRSYIACPLEDEGKVVGVVYVDRCEAGAEPFAHDDIAAAVVFLKKMAAPVRGAHLIQEQARELVAARRRIADGMARVRSRYTYGNIIGKSKVMRDLFDLLERIVESDYSVVIQGESGTGKELVAKAIHFNGPKRGRPFIAENCAALT
ncbi:MAG: diguanylate cyclase, partial [Planctomycetes bacterium]|nr:diguanylate cyclase [Planctomycetota bacterium]